MNVIEKTKQILQSFPKISDICGSIHVDFTDTEPTSYSLSSVGDSLISEDILGTQTRQHTFLLSSVFSGINDYERLQNSNTLIDLSYWLKDLKNQTNLEIDGGEITEIVATNGMIYAVPENETGIKYNLQIMVTYTKE